MGKFGLTAKQLPKLISGTLICTSLAAIVLIAGLAMWMSNATNVITAQKTRDLIDGAITAILDRTVISTRDYAHWDQAYEWVSARDDDAVWESLGSGATDSDTFDIIYILEPDGTLSYAYETEGEGSDLTIVPTDFPAMVLAALANQPITDMQVLQGFAQIDDMIVVVAVTLVRPDDLTGIVFDDLPIFVGGIAIHDDRLAEMMTTFGLDDIAIRSGSQTDNAIVLTDLLGNETGQLQWRPPHPGDALLAKAMPIIILASAVLLAVTAGIARMSAGQAHDFLREYASARTDRLTGLTNRSGLDDLVQTKEIEDALDQGRVAVLYLDLTGFKLLNDSMGHAAGDTALMITAKRLAAAVRETDTVARLGGDEFLCLLIDDEPLKIAQLVADRIAALSSQPMQIGAEQRVVPSSIGIAASEPDVSWQKLLHRADLAMYHGKRRRLSRPVVYLHAMGTEDIDNDHFNVA